MHRLITTCKKKMKAGCLAHLEVLGLGVKYSIIDSLIYLSCGITKFDFSGNLRLSIHPLSSALPPSMLAEYLRIRMHVRKIIYNV